MSHYIHSTYQFVQNNHINTAFERYLNPARNGVRWINQYFLDRRLAATCNIFCKKMAEQENVPVDPYVLGPLIEKSKALHAKMRICKWDNAVQSRATLYRHIVAEEYRQGRQDNFDQQAFDSLCLSAKKWKKDKTYFFNRDLIERDTAQLREACHYPAFANLLREDPQWREEFFKWTIMNDSRVCPFTPNQVPVFVKFPGLYKDILRKLNYRSARFGGNLFQVDENQQLLTVSVEGKRVSIMKGAEKIVCKGQLGRGKKTVSVEEIFKELKGKISYDGYGDFEVLDGNIWLLNAKRIAWYNEDLMYYNTESDKYIKIDLDREDWFKQLPLQETLSFEEAESRYRIKMEGRPDGYQGDPNTLKYSGFPEGCYPIYVMRATQKKEKQLMGTHTFHEFLFVDANKKIVEVRSIGQFLYPFPFGVYETLCAIPTFNKSYMYSPDENIYNADRQHAGDYEVPPVVVRPNPEEWTNFMNSIKKDIISGWNGKLGFNFVTAHCTTRLWKKTRHHFGAGRIPDLRVPFWSLNPGGGEGKLYDFMRTPPFFTTQKVSMFIFFIFGSWKKMWVAKKHGGDKLVSFMYSENPFNSPKNWAVHPGALFKKV